MTRDPTGIVRPDIEGELEALRIYEEIIRQHPDWDGDHVDEELVETIYTPKRRQRVIAAFEWARDAAVQMIHKEPGSIFSLKEKRTLLKKLRKVQLELPPSAKVYADEPELFTKNDVAYERLGSGETRLRVGGAFILSSKSWFNMIFTFAHELGHSIDPCELRDAGFNFAAYGRLSSCFLKQNLVDTARVRSECGHNDQLSETFADWLAVRVIAKALRLYATEFSPSQVVAAAVNSVRDLCDQELSLDETDTAQHPPPEVRIERIFGRSPEIQAVLGCEPILQPGSYCTFEWRPSP